MAELTLKDAERAFRRMREKWGSGKPTNEQLMAEARYAKLNEEFRGTYKGSVRQKIKK